MEWIEARGALKSSFFSEVAMMTSQQVCYDDVRGFANVTCEDFSVDDLLDFSDKDFGEEEGSFQESYEEDETKDSFSASSEEINHVNKNEFGAFPEGELAVPVDEVENLEWLSQFVDDSGTDVSLLCHVGNFKEKIDNFSHGKSESGTRELYSLTPACKKPRGKRSRPSGRLVWALGSSSFTSESSSTSSTSQGFSTDFPCMFMDPVYESDAFFNVGKRPIKKQKKKSYGETGSESQTLRRCTHCQVQKTPQWRTGPLGPKTLCNACGVRFKSGRLFPEYRPACSPTFSQEVHSNSHRKVLEMRQRKMDDVPYAGPNC